MAKAWNSYPARLDRVIDHILDHPGERLDPAVLAGIASLPAAHWRRIYHAMRGETVWQTVGRLRAGGKRLTPGLAEPAALASWSVAITRIPALTVISLPHQGSYLTLGPVFESLFSQAMGRNLLMGAPRIFGVYHDDPTAVAADRLRSRAAITGRDARPVGPPLERVEIFGGDHAVLRHRGPYADIWTAEVWLFGTWLAASGREAADAPLIQEYLNSTLDTPPERLLTDIFLPLAPVETG